MKSPSLIEVNLQFLFWLSSFSYSDIFGHFLWQDTIVSTINEQNIETDFGIMSFSVQFLHIITWKNNKIIKIVITRTFGSMQDPILSAFASVLKISEF